MNDDRSGQAETETLRQQYADVCTSHDAITDLRTKLLGLLPLATGAGVFFVLKDQDLAAYLGAIGLFGFAVTLGLFFYELRGMQECEQLRRCGEELEKAMGLTEDLKKALKLNSVPGRFKNTPPGIIGPQTAGWILYPAVLGGWLYVSAIGFRWPQWVRLSLPALYVIVVTWALLCVARRLHKRADQDHA